MTEDEARALLAAALRTNDTETILKAFDKLEAEGFGHLVDRATGQAVDAYR